jgi:exodeoxyribonuclease V alpha subunit
MTMNLASLRARSLLSPLDEHFARVLTRLGGDTRAEIALATAFLSQQVSSGHACLDLSRWTLEAADAESEEEVAQLRKALEPRAWLNALRDSPLVSDGSRASPLVLDNHQRLYLRRYWEHERAVAGAIRTRAQQIDEVHGPTLRDGLQRLFPSRSSGTDWQRLAAALAVQRRFCVISGGPGTGKTFTVVKILALLIEQAVCAGRRWPRITLLAPTGKAAMRLGEAIQHAKGDLACDGGVKDGIPDEAATIHRCLGPLGGSGIKFRHDAATPLLTDVVLVDEASMVDLALMRRLLDATPPHARVILLGDKDQLASVEAGAVLADICNRGGRHSYSHWLAEWLERVAGERIELEPDAPPHTGIWDCIAYLRQSYRYGAGSGIGRLASAINAGDARAAVEELHAAADITFLQPDASELHPAVRAQVVDGFRPFCAAVDPLEQLQELGCFRVLCAHRQGRFGVETLNRLVEDALWHEGLLRRPQRNYSGRPIMVTQNDYQVGLFNGDVGLITDAAGQKVGVFAGSDGRARRLSVSRLPPHQSVFAMSVHKSQGSEFDAVIVVLPDRLSPVVSRELLYTAVTRARRQVTVHASRAVIEAAIQRRIERASGLREALWEAP